jgi:hypothetical protein
MRDALGVRFPACPRADGREVARLAGKVSADGVLDLSRDPDAWTDIYFDGSDDGSDDGGLRALPEGFGRLAYLPGGGHLRARGESRIWPKSGPSPETVEQRSSQGQDGGHNHPRLLIIV